MTTRSAVLGAGILDNVGYFELFTCPAGFTCLWKSFIVTSNVDVAMQVTLYIWGPAGRSVLNNGIQDAEPEIAPVPPALNVTVASIELPTVLSSHMEQIWTVLEPGMRIGLSSSHAEMHYLLMGAALQGTSTAPILLQAPVFLGPTRPA